MTVRDGGGAAIAGADVVWHIGTGSGAPGRGGDPAKTLDARTNEKGVALVRGVPNGYEGSLDVRAEGFARRSRFPVPQSLRGDPLCVDVALRPGFAIEGRVVDAAGRPAAGAFLDVYADDAATVEESAERDAALPLSVQTSPDGVVRAGHTARTGDDGTFRLSGAVPGGYYVRAFLPGHAPSTFASVSAAAPRAELRLRASSRLRGKVRVTDAGGFTESSVDASGPIEERLRRHTGIDSTRQREAQPSRVAADGSFEVPDLAPGTYEVTVQIRRGAEFIKGTARATVGEPGADPPVVEVEVSAAPR